jgi:excisionase family DNA binding protein
VLEVFLSALLRVKEAAELLKVSLATIYLLCGQGKLSHIRVGVRGRGTIRIKAEDLAAFIAANQSPAHSLPSAVELEHITKSGSPRPC